MPRRLPPFVAALVAGAALAQNPLFRVLEEPIPGDWRPFLALDVDVDGDVDLLAREGVLLNDGAGAFAPSASSSTLVADLTYATIWTILDMDGDGADDVLLSGHYPGTINYVAAYRASGAGLAPYAPTMASFAPNAFAALDYDGDGLCDLAVVAAANVFPPFGVGILRNHGNGLFIHDLAAVPTTGVATASYAAAGDFDGDGDRDLFVLHVDGSAAFWIDVGSAFVDSPGPPGNFFSPKYAAVADFDGDGADDLSFSGGSPIVNFDMFVRIAAGTPVATIVANDAAVAWAALDIDGDGAFELAVSRALTLASSPQTSMVVMRPNVPSAPPLLSWTNGPVARVAADVDGDGDLDLIAARGGRTSRVFYARGDGTLHESGGDLHAAVALLDGPPLNFDPFVGDFDGDGDQDVARYAPPVCAGAPIAVQANDGQGRFPQSSTPYLCTSQSQNARYAVADFDLDGRDDVVRTVPTTTNIFGNVLVLLFRMTAAGPVAVFIGNEAGSALPPQIFDADGDGDPDLLYGSSNGPLVTYRDPAFGGPRTTLLSGGVFTDMRVGDVTGDGISDIVIAHTAPGSSAPEVKIVDGATSTITGTGIVATYVGTADFDGDGDGDLLLDGRVYVNGGAAGFTAGALLAGSPSPPTTAVQATEFFDANLDGDPDVLSNGKLWLGAAGATFAAPQDVPFVAPFLPTAVQPRYRVADFDRDGDPDLLDPAGRLISNVSAHFAHGAPAAVGRTAELRAFGPPLQPVDVLFATGAFAQNPIPVPGWGHLFLVPNTALFLGTFPLDATGETRIPVAVPNVPALVGFQLYWQAALPLAGRLTNVEKTVVLSL